MLARHHLPSPGEVYFLHCNGKASGLVAGDIHHTCASPANVCEPVISSAWVPRFHDCLQLLHDLEDKFELLHCINH